MMRGRPVKFRLLQLFDEKPQWNYEVIPVLQKEYNRNDQYGADCINFDIIEMCSGGFLNIVETMVDVDGTYRKGSLLIKYCMTVLGKETFEGLKKTVKKKKVSG
jgi:hypothetical protein